MKKKISDIATTVMAIDTGIILFLLFCAVVLRTCDMTDIFVQEDVAVSVILFTLVVVEFLCAIIEICINIKEDMEKCFFYENCGQIKLKIHYICNNRY